MCSSHPNLKRWVLDTSTVIGVAQVVFTTNDDVIVLMTRDDFVDAPTGDGVEPPVPSTGRGRRGSDEKIGISVGGIALD